MTSQLNVDTIVDKAGSGGTNVKVGNTSTYVSEGGAVTQNTVQGLVKSWIHFDGKGSEGIRDSFNVSGITDNGTGDYTTSFTNNLSNINFCATGMCTFTAGATPRYRIISGYVWATSSIRAITGYSDVNASDHAVVGINIAGDLA